MEKSNAGKNQNTQMKDNKEIEKRCICEFVEIVEKVKKSKHIEEQIWKKERRTCLDEKSDLGRR